MCRITSSFIKLLEDIFYPAFCCVCKGRIDIRQSGTKDTEAACCETYPSFAKIVESVICPSCANGFVPIQPPLCTTCGEMFKSDEGMDHVCGACIDFPKKFCTARAAGAYSGPLMPAIHALKYNGRTGLARPLGELLFISLAKWFDINQIDMVVPVPLHKSKLRKRGFNQAYLLVRNWHRTARSYGLALPREKIKATVLARTQKTGSQTKLSRKERIENVKGAFCVTREADVSGKRVLLVDDVYTTGATVNECAKTLLADGAARVDVLTLARAIRI